MTPNILTIPIDLGGVWHLSLFFGLLACLWYNNFGWLFAWVMARGLMTLELPHLPFGDYTRAFQATTGQCMIEVILICSVARVKNLWKLIPSLAFIEIACVWIFGKGLMVAPSFDTALIALCMPFIPIQLQIAGFITIVTHHGYTALMILAAELLAIAIRCKSARIWCAISFTAIASAILLHHEYGTDRINHWVRYMEFWRSDWRYIIAGVGPGTFMLMSMLIDKFQPPLFLYMHNDYLQVLFELGLVGFVLMICLMARAIRGSWGNTKLLAGVLGASAFGLTYSPLRLFPSAMLIAMIFYRALVEERVNLEISGADRSS